MKENASGYVITSAEFRADPRRSIKAAIAGKTVTVTNAQGEPRMYVLGQAEPIEEERPMSYEEYDASDLVAVVERFCSICERELHGRDDRPHLEEDR